MFFKQNSNIICWLLSICFGKRTFCSAVIVRLCNRPVIFPKLFSKAATRWACESNRRQHSLLDWVFNALWNFQVLYRRLYTFWLDKQYSAFVKSSTFTLGFLKDLFFFFLIFSPLQAHLLQCFCINFKLRLNRCEAAKWGQCSSGFFSPQGA